MFFPLAALTLIVLEILVFAAVIDSIGFFGALGLWVLSVMAGGFLIRAQGLLTLTRAQAAFERGLFPVDALFESLCLLAAGALFVFPGFVSDILAIALLLPAFRNIFRERGADLFGMEKGRAASAGDGIIEGVYERVPDPPAGELPKAPRH